MLSFDHLFPHNQTVCLLTVLYRQQRDLSLGCASVQGAGGAVRCSAGGGSLTHLLACRGWLHAYCSFFFFIKQEGTKVAAGASEK